MPVGHEGGDVSGHQVLIPERLDRAGRPAALLRSELLAVRAAGADSAVQLPMDSMTVQAALYSVRTMGRPDVCSRW